MSNETKEVLTFSQALRKVFEKSNTQISKELGLNYNTVSSLRFRHRHAMLSTDKAKWLLQSFGYEEISEFRFVQTLDD